MTNYISPKYTDAKHEKAQKRTPYGWYLRNVRYPKSYFNRTVQLYEEQVNELRNSSQSHEMQNETLKKLLSIIAHDLKNPFNIILGFSKELYGNIDALSPDEIAEMAKRLNTSANFAYALLENLLNFCRINMDRIEPRLELLDLEKTVGGALDPLVDSAEGKHITLNNAVKPGTIVYADKTMLMTVIRNLASNSIKFTEEYGHVWVGAEYLGSNAIINVRDNGVGMPPEKAQRLFDKDEFSSTKGTAGEPGTGLGLKVVREFVTMMNGTIEPSSEVGVGTTFIITLPAAQANP